MLALEQSMKLFSLTSSSRALIAVILCLSTLSAFTQGVPDSVPRLFQDPGADPSATRSSLAAVESDLRHQVDVEPRSAPLLFRLGEVLLRENKPKDSLDIYTRAARLQKPGAEQLRLVAMDYALLKLYNDAIHWLQIAHSMDAGNVDIMYDLGRCLYTQSRFHEAEQIFSEVLQRKPDSIKAEENLALTLDKELESQRAEAAFRIAVAWASDRPADEWPFLNLGAFLLDHARATEAVPFLRKAIDIAPTNAVGHEKLGRALLQIDDVPSGLSELQTAAHIDKNNPRIHFELGRAYRDAGENEKAAAEFALSKTLYGVHSEE